MIVEIRGTGVINKGAFLMFRSIIEQFKESNLDITFIVEETKVFPLEILNEFEVSRKLNTYKKDFEFSRLLKLIPLSYRKKWNWYLIDDVEVLLDASGFFIGDQWSVESMNHKLGKDITRLKRNGAKIILLPQAFGPFEEPKVRKTAQSILNNVNLIFARDEVSFKYLESININSEIILSPDFTNLLDPNKHLSLDAKNDFNSCYLIIPNQKIVEQQITESSNSYIEFLKLLIHTIREENKIVKFLIHSGKSDLAIAKDINLQINEPLEILEPDDPVELKNIIGKSAGIITGRFHGLVSALSQGVPALATSWSHKYEMLLRDYEYSEAILPVTIDETVIKDKLFQILDEDSNKNIRFHLINAAEKEKIKTLSMWDRVFNEIRK